MATQGNAAARKTELAKIHIAKKDLGLEDDDYRAILKRVTGKASSGKMTTGERQRVLDELQKLGWNRDARRSAPEGRADGQPSHPHPPSSGRRISFRPEVRLMHQLWKALGQLGAVASGSPQALDKFVARQTGKDSANFVSPEEAHKVIQALKDMCARAGFDVPQDLGPGGIEAKRVLVRALWTKLGECGARDPADCAEEDRWRLDGYVSNRIAPNHTSISALSAEQLDETARRLAWWLGQAKMEAAAKAMNGEGTEERSQA